MPTPGAGGAGWFRGGVDIVTGACMNSSGVQVSPQETFPAAARSLEHRPSEQTRRITGIHLGHNAAAALVENGRLLFAVQEERFSRVKNQGGLPVLALDHI